MLLPLLTLEILLSFKKFWDSLLNLANGLSISWVILIAFSGGPFEEGFGVTIRNRSGLEIIKEVIGVKQTYSGQEAADLLLMDAETIHRPIQPGNSMRLSLVESSIESLGRTWSSIIGPLVGEGSLRMIPLWKSEDLNRSEVVK